MVVTEDYKRYPRTGKRGAPQVFPRKLFELLEKEDSAVIRWDEEGECFVIQDMDTFTRESLERYFKHHKFTSFQRQLNLYGFRKIAKGERCGYYVHQHFQRDHPEWLSKVRRTPQPGKSTPRSNSAPAPAPVPTGKSTKKTPVGAPVNTAKTAVKKEKEEDYSIARTMSNLISHAVGFLDTIASDAEPDAKELDEQGNPLRRSKRRQARRIREHEYHLMQIQQHQQEMEDDEEDDFDDQAFDDRAEPMKPEPVSEQPGMDDDGAFFSPASFHPATPNVNSRAKLRRINTDEAFMSAIAVCDFDELDNMDLAADPSNADMFADGALDNDASNVKTEQPTLQHDNVGDLHGGEFRNEGLSGDIDELWDEDMQIGDNDEMLDMHDDGSFLSFGDVMCL